VQAYSKWVRLIGREPLPMQADCERAVLEHTINPIADGALAGLVETILRPDHLWIENVAVAAEQRAGALDTACSTLSRVAPFRHPDVRMISDRE
jgi:hypothetical protein